MVYAEQLEKVLAELEAVAELKPGQIFVVGCSTSEVAGERMGTASNLAIAEDLLQGAVLPFVRRKGLYLAAQCCEHLNRALVVEAACAEQFGLERVHVVPHLKAGGAFSTAAYGALDQPVVVESLQAKAQAGVDLGGTLIGMHLRRVAVPVRTACREVGCARVSAARARPPLIGGERARY
jgi:uncharacterized protein (TIGR01440 family)